MQKVLEMSHRVFLELVETWRFYRRVFFGNFENKAGV